MVLSRFNMAHSFELTPGAFGFQVSNPGVLQIASLMASMSVFDKTSLTDMRTKSVALTRLGLVPWGYQPIEKML